MRNKLALAVAVILGLIAIYGVHEYLTSQKKKYETTYRTVYVVAAGERIKAGTEIKPDMLYRARGADGRAHLGISMPEQGVTVDHIMEGEATRLVGQTINRGVERGDPLLDSYFRQPVERLQEKLNLGERAMTLRVDTITGVAGNIVPGSHVDILGTFGVKKQKGASGKTLGTLPDSKTVIVLTNVRILAVDNRTRELQYITTGGSQRRASYGSVTVVVTLEEAGLLTYAQDYGTLTLILRSPADTEIKPVPDEVNDLNIFERIPPVRKARDDRLKDSKPMVAVPLPKDQ